MSEGVWVAAPGSTTQNLASNGLKLKAQRKPLLKNLVPWSLPGKKRCELFFSLCVCLVSMFAKCQAVFAITGGPAFLQSGTAQLRCRKNRQKQRFLLAQFLPSF